jgi:CRP/FNR family transcriptional regulator, cyclic AMP receptor protein
VGEQLHVLDVLSDTEREILLAKARPVWFLRESFLYHEGQPGYSLYVVVSGRLGVWAGGERGHPVLVNTIGPGEMVGEMAVLSEDHVRRAGVQALTDVRALQLDVADIEALLAQHPRTYRLFLDLLIRRVDRLTTQLAEYVDLDGATRVYRELYKFAERSTGVRSDRVPLSQQQLASLAGVSLRLASSVLTDARQENLLNTGRGYVDVLDWAAVQRRAGLGRRAISR